MARVRHAAKRDPGRETRTQADPPALCTGASGSGCGSGSGFGSGSGSGRGVSGAGGARTPSPIREVGGSDCLRVFVSAVPGSPHLRTLRSVASTCNLLATLEI